jgi:hypothetical protein
LEVQQAHSPGEEAKERPHAVSGAKEDCKCAVLAQLKLPVMIFWLREPAWGPKTLPFLYLFFTDFWFFRFFTAETQSWRVRAALAKLKSPAPLRRKDDKS